MKDRKTKDEPEEFVRRMLVLAEALKAKIHWLNNGSKRKPSKQVNVLYAQRNMLQVALAIFDSTVARIDPIKVKLGGSPGFLPSRRRISSTEHSSASEADSVQERNAGMAHPVSEDCESISFFN